MNVKKLRKYAKVADINILVYRMVAGDTTVLPQVSFPVEKQILPDGKTKYSIKENGAFVHNSFLFPKLHILKLLHKKGPAIGDCVTNPEYRGQSIYPTVINNIAHELLSTGTPEVFIIVNHDNTSSIRGIEKAGFQLYAKVKAKRFLAFYYGVAIEST